MRSRGVGKMWNWTGEWELEDGRRMKEWIQTGGDGDGELGN